MNVFAIDDEKIALSVLCKAITTAIPSASLTSFSNPDELLASAKKTHCDVAFLDISMHGKTGLEVAKELTEINKTTNIVFVTGYREYMGEAWELMASGYITKPITTEKIIKQMENLRHPIKFNKVSIHAITFGNFTLLCNDKPIGFHRAKSKELLAYLIDRKGSAITRREAAAVLFENGQYSHKEQSYMCEIIKGLEKDLKKAGADVILIHSANTLAVNPKLFSCDSYDNPDKFNGEYMSQYSWSEDSIGQFY